MDQTIRTITTLPSTMPSPLAPDPLAKRDRLERARALVIAQFGRSVLVDLEHHEVRSAQLTPSH